VAYFKTRLMPLTVSRLAPKAKAYLVWDANMRGMAVRIQPTGHRSYVLVYRYRNKPRWYHIGATDQIGLAEARKLAAELMLRVLKGEDPQTDKQAKRGNGTFAELATRYLEEHAKRKNKSWQQADKLVRRNLLPTWGRLDANSISRSDVRAIMGKMSDAPVTANQTLAAASAIFAWAIRQELLADNPCRGIERNATVSRERVLSDGEVPRFWQAFSEAGVAGAALKVLLLLGQRPGEVTRMRFDQIDDNGWWTLPGAPDAATGWPGTKNSQSHRIWLPRAVREIIEGLNVGDPFVFGQPLNVTRPMQDILQATEGAARDTARSTTHARQHNHPAWIWSRLHEPNSKSSRWWYRFSLRPL
jgi:integrase